jgi:hypothetical protein
MPRPVTAVACESIVSRAGVRTALPNRSEITSALAEPTARVRASRGTETTVSA